jgi:hypothetical protein
VYRVHQLRDAATGYSGSWPISEVATPLTEVSSMGRAALVKGSATSGPSAKSPHHGCAVPDISDLLGTMTRPTDFAFYFEEANLFGPPSRSPCLDGPAQRRTDLGHVDWWHRCGRARHEIGLVLASCGQHERKSDKENQKPSHRAPSNQGIASITKGSLAVSRTA